MKAFVPIALGIVVVLFISGCISGLDAESLAKASPIVQDFLEDHPNAEILATYFTENQSEMMLAEIREECANPLLEAVESYRVRFTDKDTGFNAVVWIDWEERRVICAFKKGEGSDVIENCTSHAEAKCYGQHVYWFDSCGYKEEKKEYCEYGCENETCKPAEGCKSHAEYKCYGEHVYWFDSCGHKQEKKEYCQYGCELGFCKNKTIEECYDSDGGKDYHVKGYVVYDEDKKWDTCENDKIINEVYCCDGLEASVICTTTYECPYKCENGVCINQTINCTDHSYYKCYDGDVYWHDSCDNREDRKEDCLYGCENGVCMNQTINCTSHHEYRCYDQHVYWYDSCDTREGMKEQCEHGCESGACVIPALEQLTSGFEHYTPRWSPDGDKLSFHTSGCQEAWIMNSDGSNQIQLTDTYCCVPGDWSPDGTIVYTNGTTVADVYIYTMNSDGSNNTMVSDPGSGGLSDFSPDGTSIAFEIYTGNNRDIWVMNSDGSNLTRLTTHTASDWYPVYSPNGSKILFGSDRSGNGDIWIMEADGNNQKQLTSTPWYELTCGWSPDGDKIVYASDETGNYDIWVINVNGTGKTQLTTNSARDVHPVWSPDGTKIAFQSDRSGNNQIWVMTIV